MFQSIKSRYKKLNLKIVEGQIPAELNGHLFRVGVGQFEEYGIPLNHWFDGPGFITKFSFSKGKIQGHLGLLEVNKQDEKILKQYIYGRFGVPPRSLWNRIKAIWDYSTYTNSANTALFIWQNRLYALYEGCVPTEIDSRTLEAKGECDFNIIKRSFSAHPKFLPSRSTHFNFGFRVLPRPCLDLYSLPQQGPASRFGSVPYNGTNFIHDFGVTDNHFIFLCSPVFSNPVDMIIKGKSLAKCMSYTQKKDLEVIVVPIDNPKKYFKLQMPPHLFTHTVNAYEEGAKITMYGVMYQDGSNLQWINTALDDSKQTPSSPGQVYEISIDTMSKTIDHKVIFREAIEVPTINNKYMGAKNRYFYAAGYSQQQTKHRGFYDALYKFDLETQKSVLIQESRNQIVNEPIFVTKHHSDSEDSGFLLSIQYDSIENKSYLSIHDVSLDNPTLVCKVSLGEPIPFTFHGLWTD